jgi:hypothetical protein
MRRALLVPSHASMEFGRIFPAQPHLDLAEFGPYPFADATMSLDNG